MRVVLIGAGALSLATAEALLRRGHDVAIIESSKEKIETLSQHMDCGFLCGDGSKPAVLREAGPADTDFLLCLTGQDQTNILASLVGRSLGYKRVVVKIEDPEFVHICLELGLSDTIVPDQTIARTLADMVAGRDILELSAMIKGELTFFSFVARDVDAGPVADLKLPNRSRIVCVYRNNDLVFPDETTKLATGDEVVLATHSGNLTALKERWAEPNV